MSVYPPPTFEEYLSVFNPADWGAGSSSGLDIAYLNANYLKYPVAQGTETLIDANVSGVLGISKYIAFSDGTRQSTASPGLVNIVEYGAVGNGTTDCTTAINNALAALGAGYKTLYIPQGRFKITAGITFPTLTNANIFSEGEIVIGANNVTAFTFVNLNKFSINGLLLITNDGGYTNSKGLSFTAGSDTIQNLNVSNITCTNLSTALFCGAVGFSPKIFSDLIFSNCGVAIENRGEYNLFNNVNITACSYGILNYGGNNSYSNGTVKTCNYGLIVGTFNVGNPDHSGIFNFTFNHNINVPIICAYINLSWTISNCIFYANTGTIGNPTPPTVASFVPASYQSQTCNGVYIQGGVCVEILNCVFGLNGDNPIYINGSNYCNICNNQFLQSSGTAFIRVAGITLFNVNANCLVSNNSYGGTFPYVTFDNSIDANTISKSTNFKITNNSGVNNFVNFNNTGVATTQYITGNAPFYTINEGQTDTLVLANLAQNTQFTINYKRSGSYNYTLAPTYTDLIVLQTGLGGTNGVPNICDGLTNTTTTFNGSTAQVIRFHKEGSYIFQPSALTTVNDAGYYTIFQTVKDVNLYYNPTLDATTAVNLNSVLYLNSTVNITTALGSANQNITLPDPTFSAGSIYIGSTIKIFNNTNFILTLGRPGATGIFTGAYGNDTTSITLPDNTWATITFDGTNYLINERSANYSFLFSGIAPGLDYTSRFNYTNATLNIGTTSAGNFNWIIPSATRAHQTTTIVNNIGTFDITFTIASGVFSGFYGSGLTTLLIPAGRWVQLYSDGTNWRVDSRSQDYIYPIYLNPTTNFTSNNQYLDSTIELNPPDNAQFGSGLTLSGNATQSGTVLTTTAVVGVIAVGSVITFNSVRMIVYAQTGGTAGGAGTYIVSYNQTVGVSTAYTGVGSTIQVITGTMTTNRMIDQSTVNIPVTTINTITSGGNKLFAGNPIYASGMTSNLTYLLSPGVSPLGGTGICNISACPTTTYTSATFFSTQAGQIIIPNPTTSLYQRRITVINNSYLPCNIVNTAGTAVFAGQFGHQGNTGLSPAPANNASQYLLMPSRTVVLECDGTRWNAITGTTISATKVFFMQSSTTPAGDNTLGLAGTTNVYPLNCSDGGLNSLLFNNIGAGEIQNTSNYPMTLSVNYRVLWNNPATATGSCIGNRMLGIAYGSNLTGGAASNFPQITYSNTSPIFQTATVSGVNVSYTYLVNTMTQQISQTVVLNYNDSFKLQLGKQNASGTTESINNCYITVQRLS